MPNFRLHLFSFLLLLTTSFVFSQTQFEEKISELGITELNNPTYSRGEIFADNTFLERNHLNSYKNFGLLQGWDDGNLGAEEIENREIITRLYESFVLFTFPNSVGGLIQNPNHSFVNYNEQFNIYIYDDNGGLISYFSSSGLDQNGDALSTSTAAHFYYNQVYLNSNINTPFVDDSKWGASFPEQAPGSRLKIIFELYSADNSTSKGFYVETIVSENVFLPYTKYNPWNDEIFGIAQTNAKIQIKNSADQILETNISTGSTSYDYPVADWLFAHTFNGSLTTTDDIESKIETEFKAGTGYSSTSKSVIYTANKSSIDYFRANNDSYTYSFGDGTGRYDTPFKDSKPVSKDPVSSEIIINTYQGAKNYKVTEINRFTFDRTSDIDEFDFRAIGGFLIQQYTTTGKSTNPDKFWLGNDLALANTTTTTTFRNKDADWILPSDRQEMPISFSSRQNEGWWGDLRQTRAGGSLNNYALNRYIGINKVYALDTGDFYPWTEYDPYEPNKDIFINGNGLSTANVMTNFG